MEEVGRGEGRRSGGREQEEGRKARGKEQRKKKENVHIESLYFDNYTIRDYLE